jgi:hypothetical protein
MINALTDDWFEPYGCPETISFKQGKVQTSKWEKLINDVAPLNQRVICRSKNDTFNTEVEQQWQQNQHELSEEEFVNTINFLHGLQKPEDNEPLSNTNGGCNKATEGTAKYDDSSEDDNDESDTESSSGTLSHYCQTRPFQQARRKNISLCRHKLQRGTGCQTRRWRQQSRLHEQIWLPESDSEQQPEVDDTDPEWAQLRKMEELLSLQ